MSPGGVPEWPKGSDCKSDVVDFGGSNPPPSTNKELAGEKQNCLTQEVCNRSNCENGAAGLHREDFISFRHKPKETIYAGVAQLARASAFQAEGRGFESRFPLQFLNCRKAE